jgi:hypothetical protein
MIVKLVINLLNILSRSSSKYYSRIQSVPQREHHFTIKKTKLLMLFKKIIALYRQNYTEPINTVTYW